eukprot:COSAG01_NODE_39915_length_470_cov_1.115903_1_plen_86_part_10
MLDEVVESVHVAAFWHGDDRHSSTSRSQFPPSNTWHRAAYAEIVVYAQSPFAYPAAHAHLYACTGMALLSAESVHVAPFTHGDESH